MASTKVPFEGDPKSPVWLVGEAPGREEDEAGRPFIGRAGQFLERYLGRLNIPRSSVRLCNLCKYRPPKNKFKALPDDQLSEGLAELESELQEHRPNLVVALGAWPMYYLTGCAAPKSQKPGSGIGIWRGSVVPSILHNGKVLITYHPAYIIRPNGFQWHPIFFNDLGRIPKHRETPKTLEPTYDLYIDPPAALLGSLCESMASSEWLSVDIETFPGEMSCIGFADSAQRALVLTYENSPTNWPVAEYLLASATKKIFQNGRYDIDFITHFYGWPVENFAHDTLIASATILPEFPRALDFLCSIYTEFPYYKEERKEWKKTGDLETLWNYNAKDVIATYQIAMAQRRDINEMFA